MSQNNSLQVDTQSRNDIISKINEIMFVEAGAGSGKTTMLVNRIVAMVESGIPVEKICAITFTRAAATEFYERFQKLLIERSNPSNKWNNSGKAGQLPQPTPVTIKRCADALKNIDLCFMGTIDSFCSMIISEHPSEAGIPSGFRQISGEEQEVFYKQMFVKILAGEYGRDIADKAEVFRSKVQDPENAFVKGCSVFMENRNVDFVFDKYTAVDLDNTYKNEKAGLIKALQCVIDHKEIIYTTKGDTDEIVERLKVLKKTIDRSWSRNFISLMYALKNVSDIRLDAKALEKYAPSLSDYFEKKSKARTVTSSISGDNGIYTKLRMIRYTSAMTFLKACEPVLERTMLEKGYMTYFDTLYYLRNMLKKDAEGDGRLIKYINVRHRYYLIDEFQDTNPLQSEIFFYLASDAPDSEWEKCVPRPGSLFIVGDPKQSIYRFRGADVSAFVNVKKLISNNGGKILSLTQNFRSVKELCEHFNKIFSQIFDKDTPDQSKFEEIPLPPARADEFTGVYTYLAYSDKMLEDHPNEKNEFQIGKIIKEIVNNDKYKIRDKANSALRPIGFSDIMVITYSKKGIKPIMEYLNSIDIPMRVEGAIPFDSNEALDEIFRIYSAVADKKDPLALYRALTGKLIGLDESRIERFRDFGGKLSLATPFVSDESREKCTDEEALKIAAEIEKLNKLSSDASRLSPAALFTKIMDDYRVYNTVTPDNLEVVYYTLELLRKAEKSGIVVSLKDGAELIDELISGKSDEERCLSLNDNRDAVHIANLHKVKGLEAPVVILSRVSKFIEDAEKRIIRENGETNGYLFKLNPPRSDDDSKKKPAYFETSKYSDEEADEIASSKAENNRLVYVAATRAKNVLIVCDSIQPSFGKESHVSAWKDILNQKDFFTEFNVTEERPVLKRKAENFNSEDLYSAAEESGVLMDRGSETPSFAVVNPSKIHIPSKVSGNADQLPDAYEDIILRDDETVDTSENDFSELHKYADVLGTMTHKLMEMLVSSRNRVDAEEAVIEIISEYSTPSIEAFEGKLREALLNVATVMRSGGYKQTNGLPQDMLNTLLSADEVYCEVPFCYTETGENGVELCKGIMDVVYCSQGKWHIVDYKTNKDGTDLDNRYEGQLSAYIRAFKNTTGNDADAHTYHIDIDQKAEKPEISEEEWEDLQKFIDEHYVPQKSYIYTGSDFGHKGHGDGLPKNAMFALIYNRDSSSDSQTDDKLRKTGKTFVESLTELMANKKIPATKVYGLNISRQAFSKMMSKTDSKVYKGTILIICLNLKLNVEETEALLNTAGFTLSKSNQADLVVRYCIENGKYSVDYQVNPMLEKHNCKILEKYRF